MGTMTPTSSSLEENPAACGKARHRARAAAQWEAESGTGGSWSVTGGGSGVTGGGGVIGGSVATGGSGVTGSSVVTGGRGASCGSGVTGGSGCGARLWPPGLHFEGRNLSKIGPKIDPEAFQNRLGKRLQNKLAFKTDLGPIFNRFSSR